jgi:cytochrome c oxidase subunit 2
MKKSSGQAFLYAAFLLVFMLIASYTVANKTWWFPPLASVQGAEIDNLFMITLLVTGVVFIAVHLVLAWFVWRYREQDHAQAAYITHNTRFEVSAAVVVAMGLVILVGGGTTLWTKIQSPPPADAFTVEVWAEQFRWTFHYPGADGRMGKTDTRFISDENPYGLDPNDPYAKDDIFTTEMHVPYGKPIAVLLRSKDVLHDFFLPHFRLKMDVVPGMTTRMWFTPTQTGTFEIPCAELCGVGHYIMRGVLVVEPFDQFNRWLSEQTPVGLTASAAEPAPSNIATNQP